MNLNLDSRRAGNEAAFVDREDELDELEHYKNKVVSGEGRFVLLEGETGVGKTRLAEKFLEKCEEEGFRVFKSRCLYYESTEPYLPFYEALEGHFEEEEDEGFGPGFIQPKVSASSESAPMSMMGGSQRGVSQTTDLSFTDQQELMFNRVSDLLSDMSKKNPVVIFMDDLQWIDKSSAQLMHHLARMVSDNKIFFFGAYRRDELRYVEEELPLKETLSRLKGEGIVRLIEVSRLDQPSVSELVSNYIDRGDLPEDFIWTMYRETEGNPFYIVEILDSMMQDGVIDPHSYDWDPEEELSNISVPSSIMDMTNRKIERLDREEKKVLYFAALLGNEFNFEILEQIIDMDVITLLDIMDELMDQGMIDEVKGSDDELYRFDHLQTRTALREDMAKSRKRVSHQKIGDAIEEFYEDEIEDHYYELSMHFYEGKEFDKAYKYSKRSGEKSLQSLDITRAIDHFERALDSLRRSRGVENVENKEMDLLKRIGGLYVDLGEWEASKDTFEELKNRAEEVEDEKMRALGMRRIGHAYRNLEEYEEAERYLTKSLEISKQIGDEDGKGIPECYRGLGYIRWREGELEEAQEHFEKAIRKAKKEGNNRELALNYINLGNVVAMRGDHELAMQHFEKSLPILESKEIYNQLARVHNNMGDQYLKKGKKESALEQFKKCIEYAEKIGNERLIAWGSFNAAEVLTKQGNTDEALEYLRNSEERLEKLGEKVGQAGAKRVKGMIKMKDGDIDRAIELYKETKDVMKDFDAPFVEAQDLSELGKAYIEKGEYEKAQETLLEAKSKYEEMGAAEKYIEEVEDILEGIEDEE
ncbi:MAG: tetratricopeptide repeat protein [Candidatus Thermoplasmatota archaeon]|nr:tetratricopeptide repeat protein [Candidatus Thermoplasmatota archaeon]MBS3789469.1 tetratricopeptide repeat protein [Candidatus Thermoplasmatota archaeon]